MIYIFKNQMGSERLIGLHALVMHQGQCLKVSLFVFFKYTSDYTNTLELLLVKKADRAIPPYKKRNLLGKAMLLLNSYLHHDRTQKFI